MASMDIHHVYIMPIFRRELCSVVPSITKELKKQKKKKQKKQKNKKKKKKVVVTFHDGYRTIVKMTLRMYEAKRLIIEHLAKFREFGWENVMHETSKNC